MHWSKRAQEIDSFKVMDLLARTNELVNQGKDIIAMGAGEPDFSTPPLVAQAAISAIEKGLTKYTPATGIPQLKQAISDYYLKRYGVIVAPERVIVTSGASAGLLMVFSLLADAGRNILMTDPGYPCNKQFLRLVEAQAKLVDVDGETNFQLAPALVAQHWDENSAGVLVASPANPTGTMLSKEQLVELVNSVSKLGGALVVDELYHGLTYEEDAHSVLEIDQNAFVLNSFSKYFGMTGWRLGWAIVPDSAIEPIERLAQNLFISPPTVAQYAALEAFKPETIAELESRRWQFKERRDVLAKGLTDLGFVIEASPQGAFYLYVNASKFTDNTYDFCWSLLEDDGILVTPGIDFGSNDTNHMMRFSYTTSLDNIHRALARLANRLT